MSSGEVTGGDDADGGHCCSPSRPPGSGPAVSPAVDADPGRRDLHAITQAHVPAGTFSMGDSLGDRNPGDGEGPVHEVELRAFSIDATSVTNEQFAVFVAETGYRTEAELYGFSAVFHLAVRTAPRNVMGPAAGTPWWVGVYGADWQHPGGPGSGIDDLSNHPVVHVSWNDAIAYARWADRRLPTEAEWECASRGGLEGARYPWGDELLSPDTAAWRCNIWQGEFPTANTAEDGWLLTAPVETFQPNGLGLWQSVGNVWEWCADWFAADYYESSPAANPAGPDHGDRRVLRGGSYLCHDSYCNRYRNAARFSNTPDSSMGNAGFRTVALDRPVDGAAGAAVSATAMGQGE